MKKNIIWIAALVAAPVVADTVITFDDGSTLTTNDSVYVTNEKVYTKADYARGDVVFELQSPTTDRDYVAPPAPIVSQYPGDHEWCLAYTPTGTITWDEITFQRACDSDGSGSYGCGDVQFENSEDGDVCQ
jgi:hypothetical protein